MAGALKGRLCVISTQHETRSLSRFCHCVQSNKSCEAFRPTSINYRDNFHPKRHQNYSSIGASHHLKEGWGASSDWTRAYGRGRDDVRSKGEVGANFMGGGRHWRWPSIRSGN